MGAGRDETVLRILTQLSFTAAPRREHLRRLLLQRGEKEKKSSSDNTNKYGTKRNSPSSLSVVANTMKWLLSEKLTNAEATEAFLLLSVDSAVLDCEARNFQNFLPLPQAVESSAQNLLPYYVFILLFVVSCPWRIQSVWMLGKNRAINSVVINFLYSRYHSIWGIKSKQNMIHVDATIVQENFANCGRVDSERRKPKSLDRRWHTVNLYMM